MSEISTKLMLRPEPGSTLDNHINHFSLIRFYGNTTISHFSRSTSSNKVFQEDYSSNSSENVDLDNFPTLSKAQNWGN